MRVFRFILTLGLSAVFLGANYATAQGTDPAALSQWSIFKCPLLALLHIECPSCGLTRSVLLAASAHFGEATQMHPLGIPILALAVGITTALWISPKRVLALGQTIQRPSRLRDPLIYSGLASYCLWGFFLR